MHSPRWENWRKRVTVYCPHPVVILRNGRAHLSSLYRPLLFFFLPVPPRSIWIRSVPLMLFRYAPQGLLRPRCISSCCRPIAALHVRNSWERRRRCRNLLSFAVEPAGPGHFFFFFFPARPVRTVSIRVLAACFYTLHAWYFITRRNISVR